ncbi:lysophospholipid acyltransferase family protein [Szabonella alba]|uniref:Lysophospholipid acyltransferase family protein n=1 Tax=Szabonella alba TaxID=2804194 RepID=A0A8K0V982_9RHOB|nr:lysophospholipid acyltransferase family protein [Szabonella alba]MBL4917812.1 lysophospholipid acyltransferase family protein [Szabonella alba]
MQISETARRITYSGAAATPAGRAMIRLVENATGRLSLLRRARGIEDDLAAGRSFWQAVPARFGLSLDIAAGDLAAIPSQGPLVLVANHPFGLLDGLMMGHILDRIRPDFRILAHAILQGAPVVDRVVLPIRFDGSEAAMRSNLETRAMALRWLGQGGAVGIFPGGTVSTARRPFARAMDPGWRNFTARMILRSRATVVPVYFDGQNSRLFQIASHLHGSLRLGLLLREFRARTDAPVRIAIGTPLAADDLAAFAADPGALMPHLRRLTYALSPHPLPSYDYGHEFEARYRSRP